MMGDNETVNLYWFAKHVGWLNRSGFTRIDNDENPLKCLVLDGEFTLYITVDTKKNTISVKRGSHDEPTGAYFTLHAVTPPDADTLNAMPEKALRKLARMTDVDVTEDYDLDCAEDKKQFVYEIADALDDFMLDDYNDIIFDLCQPETKKEDRDVLLKAFMSNDSFKEFEAMTTKN